MFFRTASNDLVESLKMFKYLYASAFLRLKVMYRRSFLSLLWEPLTIFFVASILTLIWSQILDIEDKYSYFSYVLVGFGLWNLLFSKLITRAVLSLCSRSKDLVNQVIPISSLSIEETIFCFIGFLLTLPFILVITIPAYSIDIARAAYFLFGLFLIGLTAISLSLTLGIVTFFMRDIKQLVQAVMRISFLITPIIWTPDRLGEYQHLLWLNPFYSYIDICRTPLLGGAPHEYSIFIASGITIILSVLGIVLLGKFDGKIRRLSFS